MSVLSLSVQLQLTNTTQVTTNHTQYTHPDAQVAAFDRQLQLGVICSRVPWELEDEQPYFAGVLVM